MGLDELRRFLRKKGAAGLITETRAGTATFNVLVDVVAVSDSVVSSRLLEGVEREVLTVSHKPTEHGAERRYTLTTLGRRIYDQAAQTELEREIRKLCRVQYEREAAFERMAGKLNRGMEIRKMVTDSKPVEDREINLLEGVSSMPEMVPEEKFHEAKHERMEANLKSVEELGDAGRTGEDSN